MLRRAWDGLNAILEILADLTGTGFTARRTRPSTDTGGEEPKRDIT
jgi:hypothetical protein